MSRTNAELRKLADKGRGIKEKQDALDVELEKIKKIFREEAKARKVDHFLGDKNFVRVSPQTSTECDPQDLEQTLDDLDRHVEFYDCIRVLVTEAKAKLGETVFDSISHTKSEAYKKVSFLKSIPKKYLK
jgi:hypothetical protein